MAAVAAALTAWSCPNLIHKFLHILHFHKCSLAIFVQIPRRSENGGDGGIDLGCGRIDAVDVVVAVENRSVLSQLQ
jgi:hypothetical protein